MNKIFATLMVVLLVLCVSCTPASSPNPTPTPASFLNPTPSQQNESDTADERKLLDVECSAAQFDAYLAAKQLADNGSVNITVSDSDGNTEYEFTYTDIHTPAHGAEAFEYKGCRFEMFINYAANSRVVKDVRPIVEENDAVYLYDVLVMANKASQEPTDLEPCFEFFVTGERTAEYRVDKDGNVYIEDGDGTFYMTDTNMDLEKLYKIRMRYLGNGYMTELNDSEGGLSLPWLNDDTAVPENYKMCIHSGSGKHIDLTLDEARALFGNTGDYLAEDSTRTYLNVFDEAFIGEALQITEHYSMDGEVSMTTVFVTTDGYLAMFKTAVGIGNCSSNTRVGLIAKDCLVTYKTRLSMSFDEFNTKLQGIIQSIG